MICSKCTYTNQPEVRFCSNCGKKIAEEKKRVDYELPLKNVYALYFIILAFLLILNFTEFASTYISSLITDCIFAFIVLIFFFLNFQINKNLLLPKKIKPRLLLYVLLSAPLLAITVHYLADFINQNVFSAHNSIYYNAYLDSPSPLFFSLLSIGVFPAVFEEIAFRGVLFNETLKVTSLKSTILITSMLFTLLHFSLISSIWLFPGGLIFGYMRAKYKTLFYGMIGHFTYNSSIVLLQILLP